MGAISKLIGAGLKKLKPDSKENAMAIRTVKAKVYNDMKKEGVPEAVLLKAKKDLRKAEAAVVKFTGSSSVTPLSPKFGKKKKLATEGKAKKRTIKSTAVKKDYASKADKLKASKKSDKESNKAGESLVKAGLKKFDDTLTTADLFRGEKVPRKKDTTMKEYQEGIKERARATKRKQRYEKSKK